MKLFDKHVISEYFEVLFLATVLVAGIFLGTDEYRAVMDWICTYGIEWKKAVLCSLLQLPNMCVFALPAGTLVATIMVLSRLNRDGELLALKVAGVSQVRLMVPFLLMGLVTTVVSYGISEYVSPSARESSAKLLFIGALHGSLPVNRSSLAIEDPENGGESKSSGGVEKLLLVEKYVGSDLKNVVVFDMVNKQVQKIHWAAFGKWQKGRFQLRQGRTYPIGLTGHDVAYTGAFDQMVIDSVAKNIERAENFGPIPAHESILQLRKLIASYTSKNKPVPNYILVELYKRFSQPLACVFLVFLAFPVAAGNHHRAKSSGLIYGGVMITLYFLIQQITVAMGNAGQMDPFLAVWLPLFCMCGLGLFVYLLKKLFPERLILH
jgi:lipopolysaccharide export system permease protein